MGRDSLILSVVSYIFIIHRGLQPALSYPNMFLFFVFLVIALMSIVFGIRSINKGKQKKMSMAGIIISLIGIIIMSLLVFG